jgi:hypothetical protein
VAELENEVAFADLLRQLEQIPQAEAEDKIRDANAVLTT